MSFKAKLMNGLMRNRHLFKGHLRKPVMAMNPDAVLAFREQCEKGAARFGKVPQGVAVNQEVIGDVKSEWIVPEGAPDDKLIFYVHGGGYVSGSCNDHRAVVAKVANLTGITSLLYEYRVAPEHPYPAALEDSLGVYRAVLSKGYLPENIVMMGESAGGGLCLAVLLALKDRNIAMPRAAVAISPWTDLSCSGESYQTKNKVSLAPPDSWTVFSHYYTAGHDAKDPFVSPLYGDLQDLPPHLPQRRQQRRAHRRQPEMFQKSQITGCGYFVHRRGGDGALLPTAGSHV